MIFQLQYARDIYEVIFLNCRVINQSMNIKKGGLASHLISGGLKDHVRCCPIPLELHLCIALIVSDTANILRKCYVKHVINKLSCLKPVSIPSK